MNTPSQNDLINALKYYLRLGWRLFPVLRGAKHPIIKNWPDQASNDLETLKRWSKAFPGCNWGLATGRESGVVVLDIDNKPQPDETLDPDGGLSLSLLSAIHGRLPVTPLQRHGLGYHLFFRYPTEFAIKSGCLAEGVEVKADRHAVLLAPSISRNLPYLWDFQNRPDRLKLASPPDSWIELMQARANPQVSLPPIFNQDEKWAAEMLRKLGAWRADDYEAWTRVGMALSSLGGVGLSLWEEWSQQSPKYRPDECRRKFTTFKPGQGIGLGSLDYWVREDTPR